MRKWNLASYMPLKTAMTFLKESKFLKIQDPMAVDKSSEGKLRDGHDLQKSLKKFLQEKGWLKNHLFWTLYIREPNDAQPTSRLPR